MSVEAASSQHSSGWSDECAVDCVALSELYGSSSALFERLKEAFEGVGGGGTTASVRIEMVALRRDGQYKAGSVELTLVDLLGSAADLVRVPLRLRTDGGAMVAEVGHSVWYVVYSMDCVVCSM